MCLQIIIMRRSHSSLIYNAVSIKIFNFLFDTKFYDPVKSNDHKFASSKNKSSLLIGI